MEEPEYIRLHITPFNPDLLKTILPASILPNARNISYHSILTFPEKAYGYVELPIMDAEKIKKKLNGTTLKGTKVRIEKAREEKVVLEEEEEPEQPKRVRKTKRKRDELPGVEIGERQVKRGWTTPAKDVKKDQMVIKSKYTTGPECLFKTNLPPNIASKGKLAEPKPDKKKRKPGKEAVIHEFAKTTKYATFLRGSGVSNTSRIVVEFVEGKGWVDEEGNVVEEAKKSRKIIPAPTERELEGKGQDTDPMEVDEVDPASAKEESSNSSSSSSEESDSESLPDVQTAEEMEQQIRAIQDAQLQSTVQGTSSESSSSSDSDEDELEVSSSSDDSSEDDSPQKLRSSPSPLVIQDVPIQESSSGSESSNESEAEAQASDASSSSSSDSSDDSDSEDSDADSDVEEPRPAATPKSQETIGPLSIKIPESLTSTPVASVHPLEALYKRPKSGVMEPPKAVESSFSFFGADGDDEEEEVHQIPLTPYTQKDFEYRGLRSAAPTPDTAHPNKRFIWPSEKDEEEDDEAIPSSPIRNSEKKKDTDKIEPESDFQKWFYENRGDVRRAWTGRKKAAAKEKRQRENRKNHRAI